MIKVWLCGRDECCPAVEIGAVEVRIGEKGNLVVLTKQQWNDLVEKINTGELKPLQA